MPLHNKEVSVKESSDQEAVKKQEHDVTLKVDESTMTAKSFQDWMEQYGWSYMTEKEKARRHSGDFD
jgi:hypothetical protein